MEIKSTNTATLSSEAMIKLQNLLLKLEHNVFRAIISAKTSQETFVINSKLGALQIKSNLDLHIGDELTLKVKPSTSTQAVSLNVSSIDRPLVKNHVAVRLNIAPIIINNKVDLKNIPNNQLHFVAKIIANDKQNIQFQDLKGNSFSISKEALNNPTLNFNKGEHVIIKWASPDKLEIQHITKEQLLHQVQRQLLPKQANNQQIHQRLTQAAFKLFEVIKNELNTNTKLSTYPLAGKSASNVKIEGAQANNLSKPTDAEKLNTPKEGIILKQQSKPAEPSSTEKNNVIIKQTQDAIKLIKNDLQRLLTTHKMTPELFKSDSIQKLLTDLSVISKPISNTMSHSTFIQKLSTIIQSIDLVLNDSESSKEKGSKQNRDDGLLSELLKITLKDAKQTMELTIHKILLQNTTSKLNQEINSSVLINTQIPFEINRKTMDAELIIKQHKNVGDENEDAWEIHLSLEMGELGLISTKILLKNNIDVSISFWAELDKTKQLFDDKKKIFQQQMSNAGFKLSQLNIFLGKKIDEAASIKISDKQFIDINV